MAQEQEQEPVGGKRTMEERPWWCKVFAGSDFSKNLPTRRGEKQTLRVIPPSSSPSPSKTDSGTSLPSSKLGGEGNAKNSKYDMDIPTRVHGLAAGNRRGPAFVGSVFTLLDFSLMSPPTTAAASSPFPFVPRAAEWVKKIVDSTKRRFSGPPIFRFFLEFDDAVNCMQRSRISSGVLGSWHLSEAYEHYKENPDLFQFVANKSQVQEAKKILRRNSKQKRMKILKGVPVFTTKNLRIAVATTSGIRWFTPYFFNKKSLDNILEGAVDKHFQSLIKNRHAIRLKDISDDDFPVDVFEDQLDSILDPSEVQELIDDVDLHDIPFDLVSKVAGVYFGHLIDEMLLGKRWIRKVIGIQPKFPYVVDSFEERAASAVLQVPEHTKRSEDVDHLEAQNPEIKEITSSAGALVSKKQKKADTLWRKPPVEQDSENDLIDRILPKITLIGFSISEPSQSNMTLLRKSMEELTKEINRHNQRAEVDSETDPLFLSNFLDFPVLGTAKSLEDEND